MNKRKLLAKIFSFGLFSVLLSAGVKSAFGKTIVFEGLPVAEDRSTEGRFAKRNLNQEEAENSKMVISKEGEKFIWESFGGKELLHTGRNEMDYFINP